MVLSSRNARGLRTPCVLADPPGVHRKGLTRASHKRRRTINVHVYVEASA